MHLIKKGISLPILGSVQDSQVYDYLPSQYPYTIGILGEDFIGLKPTMKVVEGDKIKIGQPLFEDKKNPGVLICSPVAGQIKEIVRGERRKLISVIIEVHEDDEQQQVLFEKKTDPTREDIVEILRQSGLWSLLRTRPYSKIPRLDSKPHSIFVNTMDSNPLSFDPCLALKNREDDYTIGLEILSKLSEGSIHVCHSSTTNLPLIKNNQIQYHTFDGIHPVGLVGTHIHFIDPVGINKTVWHLDLQSLLSIGKFFREGKINNTQLISIAGPGYKEPKIVRTLKGINISYLLKDKVLPGQRIISGSVFSGRKTKENTDFLGYYDHQISIIPETGDPVLLECFRPGKNRYSRTRAYLSHFLKEKKFTFTTSLQGSPRALLPYGIHEEVMPLDILPTLLLRSLLIKDTETAINLGALELDEEDVALLTYVDPGKHDFGAVLRENLNLIEKEG